MINSFILNDDSDESDEFIVYDYPEMILYMIRQFYLYTMCWVFPSIFQTSDKPTTFEIEDYPNGEFPIKDEGIRIEIVVNPATDDEPISIDELETKACEEYESK